MQSKIIEENIFQIIGIWGELNQTIQKADTSKIGMNEEAEKVVMIIDDIKNLFMKNDQDIQKLLPYNELDR
jgi:hypothetical protein